MLSSCKNDKKAMPSFSATGYWRGNASPVPIAILNRPDRTSRLYLLNNTDTASIMHKYDGSYTINQDVFRFQSYPNKDSIEFYVETRYSSSGSMSGVFLMCSSSEKRGIDIPFENNNQ